MGLGRLSNKVAIVTGAGRGIGRGIALAYGDENAKVVVASRTQNTIDEVVKEIQSAGGTALGIRCDVGERDQVFAMVDKTVAAFGRVDILVNNAQGFGPAEKPTATPVVQPLETFDESEWEHTFRTGVTASLWAMKAVFPHMKNNGGKIINFSSGWGQIGFPGTAAYNANKEAIRGLTRTAAREWGPCGINVNAISPSVMTDAMAQYQKDFPEEAAAELLKVPMRRWGDPLRDGGGLAIFRASAESDYLTGMTFMLEGGYHMYP